MRVLVVTMLLLVCPEMRAATETKPAQVSSDCKTWIPISEAENKNTDLSKRGYLKHGDEIVRYDNSNHLWIQMGKIPLVFVQRDKEVLLLSDSFVEAHTLKAPSGDTLINLMLTIGEVAREMGQENRWSLRWKGQDAQLLAMLMGAKKCSTEPKVIAVVCDVAKGCAIGPKANDPKGGAKKCLQELGLLEPSALDGLRSACETVTDEARFKNIEQNYSEARMKCGNKGAAIPSLETMKKVCADAQKIMSQLSR